MQSRIYLRNLGPLVMPVDLTLYFDDGSQRAAPICRSRSGSTATAIPCVAVPDKRVVSVVIDPDTGFVDLDRTNNQADRPGADALDRDHVR